MATVGQLPALDTTAAENLTRTDFLELIRVLAGMGDITYYEAFGYGNVFINRPDAVREFLVDERHKFDKGFQLELLLRLFLGNGLFISAGDAWKRQRKLIQPKFNHTRIASYADSMVLTAQDWMDRWQAGQEIELEDIMARLALDVVNLTLFDLSPGVGADVLGKAMLAIQDNVTAEIRNFNTWVFLSNKYLPKMPRFVRSLLSPKWRAQAKIDKFIYDLIAQRKKTGEQNDLLSLLMFAENENGERMSDTQVRDEAVTMFLAGHETTAVSMAWTWYLLSQNPEVEAKLHAELAAVLGGRPPAMEDLKALPYTDMIVKEAMRLYPPVFLFGGTVIADEGVTIAGVHLPKGMNVNVSPYAMQRTEQWFHDSDKFMPERFAAGVSDGRDKYTYFPFGGGPRICIGNEFSMMEQRLILATLAQKWRMRLAPGQTIYEVPVLTLRSVNGIRMVLEPR